MGKSAFTAADCQPVTPSSRCRRHRTHVLASLDQQAGSHSGTAACGRRQMKQQGRQSNVGSDLLWEREMRMRRDKTGDVVGRPSLRSSFLGDPGAKFLCGKLAIGTKKEKRSKKKERPVGTWAAVRAPRVAPMAWKNECLRVACESVSRHLLGVPPPLMRCSLPRMPVRGTCPSTRLYIR